MPHHRYRHHKVLAKSRWGYPVTFIQRIYERYGGEATPLKRISDLFDLLLYFKRYGVLGSELTGHSSADISNFRRRLKRLWRYLNDEIDEMQVISILIIFLKNNIIF
jgi:hypothetical protein